MPEWNRHAFEMPEWNRECHDISVPLWNFEGMSVPFWHEEPNVSVSSQNHSSQTIVSAKDNFWKKHSPEITFPNNIFPKMFHHVPDKFFLFWTYVFPFFDKFFTTKNGIYEHMFVGHLSLWRQSRLCRLCLLGRQVRMMDIVV